MERFAFSGFGATRGLAWGFIWVLAQVAGMATAGEIPGSMTVAVREWPQLYVAEGVVEAVRQTTVAAQIPGRIVALQAKAGDSVRAGQVLARIDPRTAEQALAASRSQVAEIEATLANAGAKLERNRALLVRKFVSQAAVDQAEAEYKAAEAQLAAAKANASQSAAAHSYTVVAAPYAGTVASVDAELGDMAMPGKAILTLFDPSPLRVSATLPQAVIARARLDQPIPVELPAQGRTVVATRATVVPVADARSHTTRVRLDLPPGESALPGQYARARFAVGKVQALAVPESAVLRRGELTAVYVIDAQGKPQLRQIRLGEPLGDAESGVMREVLSGLSGGERIALNPLQAGMLSASAQPRP